MIHPIKNIWFFVLFMLLVGCNEKQTTAQDKQTLIAETIQKDSIQQQQFEFSAIYPIGSVDTSKQDSIRKFYQNVSFRLGEASIEVIGIGTEEIYKNKLSSNKYFSHTYLKTYYQKLFSENYKTDLSDTVVSIRNKNAHQKNSLLKPYFDDAFVANGYLILEHNGFSILFQNRTDKSPVISKSNTNHNSLFNSELVGLSIIDSIETDPYKRYGLDFMTVCYCDSPSLYIDKESEELIIFNYCEVNKTPKDLEKSFVYKIIEMEMDKFKMSITTDSNLKIDFDKVENFPIYKIHVTGKFPKDYVGGQLRTHFTSEPDKFSKADCGDFDG